MYLVQRDVGGDIGNITSTFTSFDNCMSKNYCKIPFIVICVVAGIVVFSLLYCLLRCWVCGYACCACCFGGCGGRKKPRKQREPHILPPPTSGFPVRQPLSPEPGPGSGPLRPPGPEPPKYAYFDTRNDDALPSMPTMEAQETQKVAVVVKDEPVVAEEHELEPLRTPGPRDPERRVPTPLQALRHAGEQQRVPTPLQALRQGDERGHAERGPSRMQFGAPVPKSGPPAVLAGGGGYRERGGQEAYASRGPNGQPRSNWDDRRGPQDQYGSDQYGQYPQQQQGPYRHHPRQQPQYPQQPRRQQPQGQQPLHPLHPQQSQRQRPPHAQNLEHLQRQQPPYLPQAQQPAYSPHSYRGAPLPPQQIYPPQPHPYRSSPQPQQPVYPPQAPPQEQFYEGQRRQKEWAIV